MKVAVVQLPIAAFPLLAANRATRGQPPTVIVNPPDDHDFRTLVERVLLAGGIEPDELQAALRERYPATVVRRRELTGERLEVWYVYRDGHWIRSDPDARP